jgi:hypothetical protein
MRCEEIRLLDGVGAEGAALGSSIEDPISTQRGKA